MFKPFGPASFIPIDKILDVCVTCTMKVNDEVVIAVNPIRKFSYKTCTLRLFVLYLYHMQFTFHLYLNIGKLKGNINYDMSHMYGKCGANIDGYTLHM